MYKAVIDVKPLADYMLQITFEDNTIKKFDVKPYLGVGIFSELKDIGLFNSVNVVFDTIEWPNGADIDPEVLYQESIVISTQSIA
ncbi:MULTISPECIES: DUF2442 domain-containing protein [unclassified Oceanispirochaeta]|uniref:DUF2442 domain-containing protein n=1 Tax=unclassified Oceanispirochaeta TaxID=2635722 RepID=UPI000E09B3D0|nr:MULTISPECIES: DUF2442 domain-containing protein [unclassified Oceanispirochaeta]MBF9017806.1 DUF2442 domain-containing protein [Oceanispirochaeta sp. M2]NPD74266.1 DUF2442 domain-containing protein [Oceanispirochaeta sp. M1]RDG29856.1 DUF2442 domain-containing protein [Oceanispirochaeta sp. M1]